MSENTKEIIWKQALVLFSTHGYEGTSVKAIANAVGIKDSSLYKHYKSKQEIFETIIDKATKRISEASDLLTIPANSDIVDKDKNIKLDVLGDMCYNMISFHLTDDIISKFRKMLTIEQYKNDQVATLFQKIFIDDVLEFESNLFRELISKGHFVQSDPYVMALHFYSPIFLLLYKFDKGDVQITNLKILIDNLIQLFVKAYGKKEKNNEE